MESELHKRAKARIAATIGHGIPLIRRFCRHCAQPVEALLPRRITYAREEVRLASGRIVDVGLFDDQGQLVAAVEIYASNSVDPPKARSLAAEGVPCAELRADEAARDPMTWIPRPQLTRPVCCQVCAQSQRLCAAAGLPQWINQLCGARSRLLRRGRELRLVSDRFDVVVAWLAETPVDFGARDRPSPPLGLPSYSRFYLELCDALHRWGGEISPDLDRGWTGRFDPSPSRWTELRRVALETRQPVPAKGSRYWAEVARCRRCDEQMLTYGWRDHGAMLASEPPNPIPSTIQNRQRWVNVCPRCDTGQADTHGYRHSARRQ